MAIENLNQEDFKELYKTSNNAVLLDVRTPQEWEEDGYIPSATFLDIYDPEFMSKILEMDKQKDYFVYCRAGGRSLNACSMMESMGFKGKIYNLIGGISEWNGEIEHN